MMKKAIALILICIALLLVIIDSNKYIQYLSWIVMLHFMISWIKEKIDSKKYK